MTAPLGPYTLQALLGLPADVDVDRLRYVYEQAMAAATRRGDRTRALTLSRAYDALPAATRQQMFPRNKARATLPSRTAAPPIWPADHAQSPPKPRRRPDSSAFTISDRTIRLLIWLLGVPIAVFAGVAIAGHEYDNSQAPAPSYRQTMVPAVVNVPSVPPASVLEGHRRTIPNDAPTDASGWVDVLCQRKPGGPGYEIRLRRGQIAYCTNGATPTIIG